MILKVTGKGKTIPLRTFTRKGDRGVQLGLWVSSRKPNRNGLLRKVIDNNLCALVHNVVSVSNYAFYGNLSMNGVLDVTTSPIRIIFPSGKVSSLFSITELFRRAFEMLCESIVEPVTSTMHANKSDRKVYHAASFYLRTFFVKLFLMITNAVCTRTVHSEQSLMGQAGKCFGGMLISFQLIRILLSSEKLAWLRMVLYFYFAFLAFLVLLQHVTSGTIYWIY